MNLFKLVTAFILANGLVYLCVSFFAWDFGWWEAIPDTGSLERVLGLLCWVLWVSLLTVNFCRIEFEIIKEQSK